MQYLVDTNVWLERMLDQERSQEVGDFLERCAPNRLAITDFAFHSIAVILARLGKQRTLIEFVQDVFVDAGVAIVRLRPDDTREIVAAMEAFGLDFDDAYQYTAADKAGIRVVSFDGDFDRTRMGRLLPGDAD